VAIGSSAARALGVNDTVTITGLATGLQQLIVGGVSTNCYSMDARTEVAVVADAMRDVVLGFECIRMNDITLTFERRDGQRPIVNLAGIQSGTGSVERLTFRAGIDVAPDWSADGSRLAFSRDGAIHVINADGTGLRSFGDRGKGTNPAWSPDGSVIAYDDGQQVLAFAPDGSGETVLGAGTVPAWSPDGARIAVEVASADNLEVDVIVMNADGSQRTNITPVALLLDRQPAWSPDGSRIVFRRLDRSETTGYDLWVVDADGSNQDKILELNDAQLGPLWLPGNRILFDHDRAIWALDLDAGSALTNLTGESGFLHNHVTVRQ